MTDIEKVKGLFKKNNLYFPAIPGQLALRIEERSNWLFSTRTDEMWPYNLAEYIGEVDERRVEDYALLSHSGHGLNSYALQYYLVCGPLEMFLHLAWGGVYSKPERTAAQICACFMLADEIVTFAGLTKKVEPGAKLRIVGSNFYGSYWYIHTEDKSAGESELQEDNICSELPQDEGEIDLFEFFEKCKQPDCAESKKIQKSRGERSWEKGKHDRMPAMVLTEALHWLKE